MQKSFIMLWRTWRCQQEMVGCHKMWRLTATVERHIEILLPTDCVPPAFKLFPWPDNSRWQCRHVTHDTWHAARWRRVSYQQCQCQCYRFPVTRLPVTYYTLHFSRAWPYHWNPSVIWSDVNCVLVYLHPPTASNHVIWVSSYFKCHNGFLITMFKNVI